MLFQLPNGRTIELTFDQWLGITDDDIEYLVAHGHGEVITNPFAGSSLQGAKKQKKEKDSDDPPPDTISLTAEEKLSDLDLDSSMD